MSVEETVEARISELDELIADLAAKVEEVDLQSRPDRERLWGLRQERAAWHDALQRSGLRGAG